MRTKILVIGGDGTIGSSLVSEWRQARQVTRTSRREPSPSNSQTIFLDFARPGSILPDEKWDAAVVCAGAVRVQACHDDPKGTWAVNVENIPNVVEQLVARGTYVLALSTNQIFSGDQALVPEDAPRNPVTEYGRQKAAAEERFEAIGLEYIGILRLTKVFEPTPPLLRKWVSDWKKGEITRPFSDMPVSPVSLGQVVETITRLVDERATGAWNFGGASEMSYSDLASLGAKTLGFSPDLVSPQTTAEAGYFERVPRHSSLGSERIWREMGISSPNIHDLATKIFLRFKEDGG